MAFFVLTVQLFFCLIIEQSCKLLVKNEILAFQQFGIVKGKGTTDAIEYLTNLIYKNIDESKQIIVTFLDLAKAFDTVNHNILLEKLNCYGMRGNALNLFNSYLTCRQQKVKIKNNVREYCDINTGVPQGTVHNICQRHVKKYAK